MDQAGIPSIEQLRRVLASEEPPNLDSYLVIPTEGQAYHFGTMAPKLGGLPSSTKRPFGTGWLTSRYGAA